MIKTMKRRKKKIQIHKNPPTKREKWIIRLALFISFIFIFIGMLSCAEINEMDNNLVGVSFFFLFFAIGLLIGYILNILIEKKLPEYLINSASYKTIEGSFFAFALILPALANYYNRTYPLSKPEYRSYKVVEKSKSNYKSSTYTYWLYVDIDNDKERLLTNEETWDKVRESSYVKLGIATGGLGFPFVAEIHPN